MDKQRSVVVTGAESGIGAACAAAFGALGDAVSVFYFSDEAAAHKSVAAVEQAGGRALAIQCNVGDEASARILEVILREEVAHVAAGSRWFHYCCARDGLAPGREFIRLVREVARASVRPPFNREARLAAGFDAEELARLEGFGA